VKHGNPLKSNVPISTTKGLGAAMTISGDFLIVAMEHKLFKLSVDSHEWTCAPPSASQSVLCIPSNGSKITVTFGKSDPIRILKQRTGND
jgi:hypothetical protein